MNLVFLHGDQPVEYKKIIDLYYKTVMESGLPCSRFIYWNLSQKYIDSIYNHPNCFYLSGVSPLLLKNLYLFTPLHTLRVQSASPCSLITALPSGVGVLNVQRCNKTKKVDAFQFISSILGKVYYDDIEISRFIL